MTFKRLNQVLLAWILLSLSLITKAEINRDFSKFLERLSPNEGLSQAYVTEIAQDLDGYLWFGTQMGLNRYDGYNIKQIPGPDNVFANNHISDLFVDDQGYLWVSTMYSGLYRLDPHSFVSEQLYDGKYIEDPKYYAEVIDLVQLNKAEFILAIANGVYRLNVETGQITNIILLQTNDDIFRDLLIAGKTLFAASSDGLYKLDLESGQYSLIPHKPESATHEDSANTKSLYRDDKLGLLVGTVAGLYQVPLSQDHTEVIGEPQTLVPELNIWGILPDENAYILATNKGLFEVNPYTKQLTQLIKFSESLYRIKDDNVVSILEDSAENIWLGSRSQGVMKWSSMARRFGHITGTTSPALSNENVWAIHQDKEGAIWVGTDNGLNKLNVTDATVSTFLFNTDLKNVGGKQVIYKIFDNLDDSNRLWLNTDAGLFQFDKTTGEIAKPYLNADAENIVKNNRFYGVHVYDNENIMFANQQGFLNYNANTGSVTLNESLGSKFDVDLFHGFIGQLPGQTDKILVAMSGHLYQFDRVSGQTQLVYKVSNYQPQSFETVDSWVVDEHGTLWLAFTGEGLIGVDVNTFEERYRFDTSNQLLSNFVYGVQLDAYQNVWFSSQAGLYRLDLNNMHVENFTANDGLIAAEFNAMAYAKLQNNALAYGGPNGVTLVSPSYFQQKQALTKEVNVYLSEANMLQPERSLSWHELETGIELPYDSYGLNMQFSTLQFNRQQQTKYSYKLTGPAPLNLVNITSNELMLSKLPAGKYDLNVTAIDPATGLESPPLNIKLHSLHAPWASPLAKLFYVIVVLSLLASFIMNRQKRRNLLLAAHKKVKDSRNQMQLALYGSNSGIWDYHIETDELYQDRLYTELGHPEHQQPISLSKHARLINQEQSKQLAPQWQEFIKGNMDTWDVSYQIRSHSGEWLWYRDIGKVIKRDADGKPLRVTGTYTNITQTKANEARALLFGEAFSQINDWVLILDGDKQPLTANDAFIRAFGLDARNTELSLALLLDRMGSQKNQEFNEILDSLQAKQSWQGEETIKTVSSEQHPVLIKITAIANNQNVVTHYVVVLSDITTQKHAEEKLRHLAHYDYLTDLPNRKLIMEKIETKLQDKDKPFALFFIDLDKFKQVNDLYGHLIGDSLLKQVASILVRCVNHNDIVARQSGDEFIVLVDEFPNLDHLGHLAQKVNELLAQPIIIGPQHLNITSSIGISIYPSDADNATSLIKKADLAMIHAKRKGRGEFQLYTQDLNDKAHQRLTLENEIKEACQNKEFCNYYQPIVDQKSSQVVGVELLMRWQRGESMISPGVFIPIAEEMGLISTMTIDAIETALTDYCRWQSKYPDLYISINLSPVHILQEGLCKTLTTLLAKHNLPSKVLRLEITEGTLLADLDVAIRRLNELRIHGFKLLLDDFGTGYSSMTYLSRFPIDYLKIDKSFTLNLEKETNRSIIKSIIYLADNLNLQCIAEGVETTEQLDCVTGLGCNLIQGFLYAKPLPFDDFIAFTLPQNTQSQQSSANAS